VSCQEALGFAAVTAPGGRVEGEIHRVLFYPVASRGRGMVGLESSYVPA
jgi:hypothetical protein